jgi:twitching motility protein PilT
MSDAPLIDTLFRAMVEVGASDLHLSVGTTPMVRKDGQMQPLDAAMPALTEPMVTQLLAPIMPEKNRHEFSQRRDSDFATRSRARAISREHTEGSQRHGRRLSRPSLEDLTVEQLGLSPDMQQLCYLTKGLVLVTGPTGSGKSTTLCAMIDYVNRTRNDHIITIEDPIEFVHQNKRASSPARGRRTHTRASRDALRAALREDPDIVLVGELRDLETVAIAIETAETGHLVFGTLHTTTAASTIDRIIDQFPADRQEQIR